MDLWPNSWLRALSLQNIAMSRQQKSYISQSVSEDH